VLFDSERARGRWHQHLFGKSGQSYPFRYPNAAGCLRLRACWFPASAVRSRALQLVFPMRHRDGAGHQCFTVSIFSTLPSGVVQIGHTARHAPAPKFARSRRGSTATPRHVFAPVAAAAFRSRHLRTRVADPETFTCHGPLRTEALGRAIQHGVMRMMVLLRATMVLAIDGRRRCTPTGPCT